MKRFERRPKERSSGRFNREGSERRGPSRFGRDSESRGPSRFGRNSDRRESGGFGRERFNKKPERLKMYEVVCDKCGQKCEVPFNPTSDKPVYCSECFKGKEGSSDRGNKSQQLDSIHEKLDRIMKALHIE